MTSALPFPESVPSTPTVPLRPHLTAVPPCEPPYDDELPAGAATVRPSAARPAGYMVGTAGARVGRPIVDWSVPSWSRDADVGVTRTSASALPPAGETAGVMARALIEAMAGYRPLAQLRNSCSPEVYAGLRPPSAATGRPPKLLSIRTSQPADGVAEATAVFRRGSRAAAMAFRLQGLDGRWRITALQIG